MNKKYAVFIGVLSISAIVLLFGQSIYSLVDVNYLQGKSQYNYLPKDIQQKHSATIEKVDMLIRKENPEAITSQSKDFNLEVYLKYIQVGVYPYLKEDDPLNKDTELLIQDILNYIRQ
jgi:hypothetical protein